MVNQLEKAYQASNLRVKLKIIVINFDVPKCGFIKVALAKAEAVPPLFEFSR
jgi:hypothetical protein